jgi:hypothetical protein
VLRDRNLAAFGFVSDRRDVQCEVRRTADRRAHAEGVFDSLAADDLPGRDRVADQLDDLTARGLRRA